MVSDAALYNMRHYSLAAWCKECLISTILILLFWNVEVTGQVGHLNWYAVDYLAAKETNLHFPFSFAVTGDPQQQGCSPCWYEPCFGVDESFKKLMNPEITNSIGYFANDLALVIIVGDLVVEGGCWQMYEAYREFIYNWMLTTGTPVFSLPGNHDFYGGGGHQHYLQYIDNRLDYTFDLTVESKTCRFIAIDNVQKNDGDESKDNPYRITQSQLNQVEAWLDRPSFLRFTFYHCPLSANTSYIQTTDYEKLKALHQKYGVKATFAGHNHIFRYWQSNCTDYFKIGRASIAEWKGGKYARWLKVTVYESGIISTELYRMYKDADTEEYIIKQVTGDSTLPENRQLVGRVEDCKFYAARNTIVAGSNTKLYEVAEGGDVTCVAGDKIIIHSNFKVHDRGRFRATIDPRLRTAR